MISRLLPRFSGASIGGAGLRERLRSTTFALLGAVTAVGLVLVGIAYNQGWPEFADSPIPELRTEGVAKARVVAGPIAPRARPARDQAPRGSSGPGRGGEDLRPSPSNGSSEQQLAAATAPDDQVPVPSGQGGIEAPAAPAKQPQTGSAPADPPAATESPTTAGPAPAPPAAPPPAPAPVSTSPPAAPAAEVSSVPGKGKAKGHEKSHGQSPPPAAPPPPPPAPEGPAEEAPPPAAPGNGHWQANGHSK